MLRTFLRRVKPTALKPRFSSTPTPIYSTVNQPAKLGTSLSKYGVNLSKYAADGKLDPGMSECFIVIFLVKIISCYLSLVTYVRYQPKLVIGRDEEIERAIQVLSRRTKNNPCLIGEPGVSNTIRKLYYYSEIGRAHV